jgi:CRISPR system Cascade subunit CasC
VQRARVSSQSWKRAIREMAAKELDDNQAFKGIRSRLFVSKIIQSLLELDVNPEDAKIFASCAGHYLAKLDPKQEGKVKTLIFLSPSEYKIFATILESLEEKDKKVLRDAFAAVDISKLGSDDDDDSDDDNEPDEKPKKKSGEKKITPKEFSKRIGKVLKSQIQKAFKAERKNAEGLVKDAADIAIFGRMVASDHSLTVEAAGMFSHALSTHKADNEIDFFAAVDDLQPKEDAGAGMTSTLEFNSATYYRFAALNLDMLEDSGHLGCMSVEERQSVVRTFLEATIKAVPSARKNTMNANTLPAYVMGVVREKGHPVQLVNAFEMPIRPGQGYVEKSVQALQTEYDKLQSIWGIESVEHIVIPATTMPDFLNRMVSHVR